MLSAIVNDVQGECSEKLTVAHNYLTGEQDPASGPRDTNDANGNVLKFSQGVSRDENVHVTNEKVESPSRSSQDADVSTKSLTGAFKRPPRNCSEQGSRLLLGFNRLSAVWLRTSFETMRR